MSKRPNSAYPGAKSNLMSSKYIHDPETYRRIKIEQSDPHFYNTRVATCSHILKGNDGRAVAVAYPVEKTGWKHPSSYQNLNKSSEVQSIMRATFSNKGSLHAGMIRKPLIPYNPNSTRSRLPIASIVMPYKNSSQVVIGDRSSNYKKHFKTINQANTV